MRSLAQATVDYLALRRSAGFLMTHEGFLLRRLVEFLKDRKARHITCDLALEFAMLPAGAQRFQWANRLRMVRGFARYRCVEDPRTEVPPPTILPYRYLRKTPTILSDDGLERLLAGALALPSKLGLRPHTYWTYFGLLASTGMRPGEPLRLHDDDVDLDTNVITVRESKGRTRLVPVHVSTSRHLQRYRARRRQLAPRAGPTFFINDAGRALTTAIANITFRKIGDGLRAFRLHGLRHRFAIRTVEQWYRDDKPIEPRMEALSTYLGHANPRHTYWYLTATPELLRLAQRRLRNTVDLRP